MRSFPFPSRTRVYRQEDLLDNFTFVMEDVLSFLDLPMHANISARIVNSGVKTKTKSAHVGDPPLFAASPGGPVHRVILNTSRNILCNCSFQAFQRAGSLFDKD